jgi:hypothetical protein
VDALFNRFDFFGLMYIGDMVFLYLVLSADMMDARQTLVWRPVSDAAKRSQMFRKLWTPHSIVLVFLV